MKSGKTERLGDLTNISDIVSDWIKTDLSNSKGNGAGKKQCIKFDFINYKK